MTAKQVAAKRGAKAPADRKPKNAAGGENQLQIGSKVFTFDPALLNDFRVLRDMRALRDAGEDGADEASVFRLVDLFERVAGKDCEAILTELEGEDGRVDVETAFETLGKIFEVVAPNS